MEKMVSRSPSCWASICKHAKFHRCFSTSRWMQNSKYQLFRNKRISFGQTFFRHNWRVIWKCEIDRAGPSYHDAGTGRERSSSQSDRLHRMSANSQAQRNQLFRVSLPQSVLHQLFALSVAELLQRKVQSGATWLQSAGRIETIACTDGLEATGRFRQSDGVQWSSVQQHGRRDARKGVPFNDYNWILILNYVSNF